MNNQEKRFEFDKQQLIEYISNQLAMINNQKPCNIFIHQIRDYSRSEYQNTGAKIILSKAESILKQGFVVSQYSSINGTMKYIGDTEKIDVHSILNYSYYKDSEITAKVLFAFPKIVTVENEELEFCSYKGKTDTLEMHDLIKLYKEKEGSKPANHHLKFCVLDAIKGAENLPSYYILGILLKYHNQNTYQFINPYTHLVYNNDNKNFKTHNDYVEDKMKKLYQTKGRNLENIFIEEYKKDEDYYYQNIEV